MIGMLTADFTSAIVSYSASPENRKRECARGSQRLNPLASAILATSKAFRFERSQLFVF